MSTRPETVSAVVKQTGIAITTRDGIRLVGDLYLPAGTHPPYPVIVERTPYDRTISRFVDTALAFTASGMAFFVQDVRGRGGSDGFFSLLPTHDEGADGADTLEWILDQPWCDGRIGTVGGSFSAANQQALALHHPAGLRAQVLRDCGTNYYRRMTRYHGLFNVGMVLPWALVHGLGGDAKNPIPPAEELINQLPQKRGDGLLAAAGDYEEMYFTIYESADDLPIWHNPMLRLEEHWDEYPDDLSVLMISGWFGHHAAANLDKFVEFSRRFTHPPRLIMGPWVHGHTMGEATVAGDVDFGADAGRWGPVLDLWVDWMTRAFSGTPPAHARASLEYFTMGGGDGTRSPEGKLRHGGRWREATTWPPPQLRQSRLYFHRDGWLNETVPTETDARIGYVFDPAEPCPGLGSTQLQSDALPAFVRPGPQNQVCDPTFAACRGRSEPLTARSDVITFRTQPLHTDLEITGPLRAVLHFSSSAPDTDVFVRLIDEHPPSVDYPDGYAMLISDGGLRLRYRDAAPTGRLLEPGRVYRVEVEMGPTSNLFVRGHRIRVDITSSNFPMYDVNPNTGEPLGRHTRIRIAEQTIEVNSEAPSHLAVHCA